MDESQIENNCFKLLEVVLQGTESWGLLGFFFGFFYWTGWSSEKNLSLSNDCTCF